MHIGVEASAAVERRRSGVGMYVEHLIGGLQATTATSDAVRFTYFSPRYDLDSASGASSLSANMIYPQDRMPSRALWLQAGLPRSLARTRPDVCHFPNYLAPVLAPVSVPCVVTLHDMTVYRYPQYQPLKTVAMHRAILPMVARQAHIFIAVSESARHDILECLPIAPDRVHVVYEGVGPEFLNPGITPAGFQQRYNLPFPYILSVGTCEPRKNHARLIDAFSQLVQQEKIPQHLVIVGAPGWKERAIMAQLHANPVADRIHWLGYVPGEDLPHLYRAADVFAFPSLYEGFGLPVLEAMASGVPCVVSSDPALWEISGGAALAVDPYNVQDIADGLYNAVANPTLATHLRKAGLARARDFSWERCATETLKLYRQAAETRPRPTYTGAADSSAPQAMLSTAKILEMANIAGNEPPGALDRAIIRAIVYADIFDFPLSMDEIQRYLEGYHASRAEVAAAIAESAYLRHRLTTQAGYVCLRGRESVLARRLSQARDVTGHLAAARRWGKVLQAVPFLRSAIITGALAASSATPSDDIDMLLLTEPGRLWLCRALVIAVVRVARLNGVYLCPNYLMADAGAHLELTERNLYTAHELAQMRLIFGRAHYMRFLGSNPWLGDILPNAAGSAQQQRGMVNDKPGLVGRALKWVGEALLGGNFGTKLEHWEQQRKVKRLSQGAADEARFDADVCKGHFGGYRQRTLEALAMKMAALDADMGVAAGVADVMEGEPVC